MSNDSIQLAKIDRRKQDQYRLSMEKSCPKAENGLHKYKWSHDFKEDDQLFELVVVREGSCIFCKQRFTEKWIYGTTVRSSGH